jgi:CRISPR/Cas system CSM-associated protein Csm3 (group 7 of RAMP superfamily)
MATDSAVVRDGLGRPFIPGSSIKGGARFAPASGLDQKPLG